MHIIPLVLTQRHHSLITLFLSTCVRVWPRFRSCHAGTTILVSFPLVPRRPVSTLRPPPFSPKRARLKPHDDNASRELASSFTHQEPLRAATWDVSLRSNSQVQQRLALDMMHVQGSLTSFCAQRHVGVLLHTFWNGWVFAALQIGKGRVSNLGSCCGSVCTSRVLVIRHSIQT